MQILAQPKKIIRADFPGQTETFRTMAKPFAGHTLSFVVVIPNAEMFFKIFPRVCQVVLRLGRDHGRTLHELPARFVYLIHLIETRIVESQSAPSIRLMQSSVATGTD